MASRLVITPVFRPIVRRPPKKRACSILQQRSMTTSRPISRAIPAASSEITPSWHQKTLAPMSTDCRASSGASWDGRKTSTMSTSCSLAASFNDA